MGFDFPFSERSGGPRIREAGKTDTVLWPTNCQEWPNVNNESLGLPRGNMILGDPQDLGPQSRPPPENTLSLAQRLPNRPLD